MPRVSGFIHGTIPSAGGLSLHPVRAREGRHSAPQSSGRVWSHPVGARERDNLPMGENQASLAVESRTRARAATSLDRVLLK